MPTSEQVAAFDSYTSSAVPSARKGDYKELMVGTGTTRRSYLYWALPYPVGASIVSAELRLYEKKRATGGTRTVTAELLAAKFVESTINYGNAPAVVSGGPTATLTQGNATTDGRMWSLDVTSLIQNVAAGTPWFGIRLTANVSTALYFHSSESTKALRPALLITWAGAPQTPVGLSPAGGRAVSVARPLHRFQFVDDLGDSITAFQLQWSGSSDFTAPTLDTGTVVSTLPQWTPTTDTAAGSGRWWRVRTRDTAGLWSPWSVPTNWVRTAKGAVTITNPATSPNNVVAEPTPPIAWTVTGAQTAWQVFILDDATDAILHDSRKQSGTETAYTPPAGVLTDTTTVYRALVRSWDDVARESIPGDSAYSEASRSFTMSLTGTVAVTDLVAVVEPGSPAVDLAWTRSTAPDFWALRVDGQFVGDLIDGPDLLVSGTSYAFQWWGATPYTDLDVEMVPIANGAATDGNNVVTVRTEPEGIWLSGTDGEDAICISTDGELGSWSDTSITAVHQAVGTPYPVLRRQTLGSRMCSQEGVLAEPGMAEAKARANRLRASGTLLRLVLSDTNVIGRVDKMPPVDPAAEFGMGARVSFDFYEQAE